MYKIINIFMQVKDNVIINDTMKGYLALSNSSTNSAFFPVRIPPDKKFRFHLPRIRNTLLDRNSGHTVSCISALFMTNFVSSTSFCFKMSTRKWTEKNGQCPYLHPIKFCETSSGYLLWETKINLLISLGNSII